MRLRDDMPKKPHTERTSHHKPTVHPASPLFLTKSEFFHPTIHVSTVSRVKTRETTGPPLHCKHRTQTCDYITTYLQNKYFHATRTSHRKSTTNPLRAVPNQHGMNPAVPKNPSRARTSLRSPPTVLKHQPRTPSTKPIIPAYRSQHSVSDFAPSD